MAQRRAFVRGKLLPMRAFADAFRAHHGRACRCAELYGGAGGHSLGLWLAGLEVDSFDHDPSHLKHFLVKPGLRAFTCDMFDVASLPMTALWPPRLVDPTRPAAKWVPVRPLRLTPSSSRARWRC